MKEQEWLYKTVEDRPKLGFTKITTYFKKNGRIRKSQKLFKPKEFGRFL